MSLFKRFERGQLRLTRLEAFSDGVFAVVVTLLVLEIKVPALAGEDSVPELAHHLLELAPKIVAWLVSFIIVCKFWLNHHHIIGLARHADYAMIWLNALFLMGQCFIPFPSALMGEYPGNPLAVAAFGVAMAVNTLLFMLLHRYILRHLMKPELADAQWPDVIAKSWIGVASYLAGAAAAWLSPYAAFAIYFLTPLFFVVPPTRYDVPLTARAAED